MELVNDVVVNISYRPHTCRGSGRPSNTERTLSRATSVGCPTYMPSSLRAMLASLHKAPTSRVLRSAGETCVGGAGAAGSTQTSSSTVYNSVTVCSFRVSVPESIISARRGRRENDKKLASFVGADHRHGAKRFDRMKLLDDRLALGHAQHTEGKRDRCHDRQAFWDSCNGQ